MDKCAFVRPKLSISETREFLAHVGKHPRLIEAACEFSLDDREVARFIARRAKTLFLVASYSKLTRLEKAAELLFISAFTSSCTVQENLAKETPSFDVFDLKPGNKCKDRNLRHRTY